MSRQFQEIVFAGALVGVFVVYALLSLGFGPNARMIPLPMAILGCVLSIAQLVRVVSRREVVPDSFADGTAETTGARNSELLALGGVLAFVVLILVTGPVAAVFLFTACYLHLSGHFVVSRALGIAALFTVVLFSLFVVGLQLELYHGILQPLVESLS